MIEIIFNPFHVNCERATANYNVVLNALFRGKALKTGNFSTRQPGDRLNNKKRMMRRALLGEL